MICRLLVIAAQYLEADFVERSSWIFLAVYTVFSLSVPVLACINYLDYDANIVDDPTHKGPLTPMWIMLVCDYGWFACLPLTTVFLPMTPNVYVHHSLVEA